MRLSGHRKAPTPSTMNSIRDTGDLCSEISQRPAQNQVDKKGQSRTAGCIASEMMVSIFGLISCLCKVRRGGFAEIIIKYQRGGATQPVLFCTSGGNLGNEKIRLFLGGERLKMTR